MASSGIPSWLKNTRGRVLTLYYIDHVTIARPAARSSGGGSVEQAVLTGGRRKFLQCYRVGVDDEFDSVRKTRYQPVRT